MVGYDSIIPPGRAGLVTESVNLSNYHEGSYSKFATISSNAKNMPSMQISIKWVIKAYISVSPASIQLIKGKDGVYQADISLSTDKANLKISEVAFKTNDQTPTPDSPAWQKDLPVIIPFVFEKDSLKKDGVHEYKYKLAVKISGLQNKTGDLIFKTNHENAQEIKIPGYFN